MMARTRTLRRAIVRWILDVDRRLAVRILLPSLLVVLATSCHDDDERSAVATATAIRIEEERHWYDGNSFHDWDAPGGVKRVRLHVDDFNHGNFLITVFDAAGEVVYAKYIGLNGDYWYTGWDFSDLGFTDDGEAGLWTIRLTFDDFTGEIELILESTDTSAPASSDEVPPPVVTSLLLDATYGEDGRASYTPESAWARRMAVDASGRAVVVGALMDSESGDDQRLAVWRFLADGSPDRPFGSGGTFTFTGARFSGGTGVAVDSAGRILASGWIGDEEHRDLAVIRLTATGELDDAFGSGGIVVFDRGEAEAGSAVTTDSRGRILVVGASQDLTRGLSHGLVVRFTTTGALDAAFGTAGWVRTAGQTDQVRDIALDASDRPIVVGVRGDSLAIWKFTVTGDVDRSFGASGVATSDGRPNEIRDGRSLAVKSDGTIAVTGVRFFDTDTDPVEMGLWCFRADGNPMPSFNGSGFVTYRFPGGWATGSGVGFDSSGRLLVAGDTRTLDVEGTDGSATLWRYTDDGVIDTTLAGADGTGAARFDARVGNAGTSASCVVVTPRGGVLTSGGATDRSIPAVDLLVWKLRS